MFSIKKQHHGIPIHEAPGASTSRTHYADSYAHGVGQSEVPSESSNRVLLYQRDPKGSAVQGQYPHCITNEAWAAPRGDETPPSRYHSCELMALDKRRHATPIDGNRRWQKMRVTTLTPGSPGSGDGKCERNLYHSQFKLTQHKRKHLAKMQKEAPVDPPAGISPSAAGTSPSAGPVGGSGLSSHRELQYCKRFNGVSLKAPQQLHGDDTVDRPWPRPGEMLKDDATSSCATPPYPSGPPRELPLTASGRAHTVQAITKYSHKSGARSEADSLNSDPELLHSSQQELALRKACSSTTMRHSPRKGNTSTFRTLNNGTSDCGSEAQSNQAFRSQRQLDHHKIRHTFTHDHPSRQRATPDPSRQSQPVIPMPRSGQWTPAHI